MKGRKRIVWLILLAAVMAGFSVCVWHSREPVYQGKRLSKWLEEIDPNELDDQEVPSNSTLAAEAVRQIGTNAVPVLLTMLQTRDSSLMRIWIDISHLIPGWSKSFVTDNTIHRRAVLGFKVLGNQAVAAIPRLTVLLENPHSGLSAARGLIRIGPAGTDALTNSFPKLDLGTKISMLTEWNTLGFQNVEATMPLLICTLSDSNRTVKVEAIYLLARYRSESKIASQVMDRLLEDPELWVRNAATNAVAIEKIRPYAYGFF